MHTELDQRLVVNIGSFGRIKPMKKIKQTSLEYPVVLRKVLNEIVISVPDLGFWKSIRLEEKSDELNSTPQSAKTARIDSDIILSEDMLMAVAECLKQTWIYVDDHLNKKKWIPEPSTFRETVKKSDIKDFTLPEFTEALSKYMSISENTVRREIKRGTIQCYQTEGGHRRIPYQELELYLNRRNTKKEIL
jgi:excisionase family DNA binding protein